MAFNPYRLTILCCLFFSPFFFTQQLEGQTLSEQHEKIRAAVERRDYPAAIAGLQSLRQAEPSIFSLNNYDYLLARLSQKRGDTATAAANFQALIARRSVLSPYALWHLSRLARETGNLTLERQYLRRLIAASPGSIFREAAHTRLAHSYFESGDDASAITALRPRGGNATASAREALALMARAYLRSGQQAEAREAFTRLVQQLRDPLQPDDFALAGARGLDLLDSGGSTELADTKAPQLSETEHLSRAFIYSFNRDFQRARLHYQAVTERFGQSARAPDALYQTGRSFYQEGRFAEAAELFKRVLDQYPQSASAREALGFQASAFHRLKRTDEAVAAYKLLIERYPDAPNPERPFLNIIDVLREAGRDNEALLWVEQTRYRFKGQLTERLALFSQARIRLSQGNWKAAFEALEALRDEHDLGGALVPGGTSHNEISFLRAYTLEQMGQTDEAVNLYLSIPDGRNQYYGGRATRRLLALGHDEHKRNTIASRLEAFRADARKALAAGRAESAKEAAQNALRLTEDEAVRRELLELARKAYASLPDYNRLPNTELLTFGRQEVIRSGTETLAGAHRDAFEPAHQALADELLFLGLYDEGAPELAFALEGSSAAEAGNKSLPNAATTGKDNSFSKRESSPVRRAFPASSRQTAYTLAVYFKRGDHADRAVRFAEPLWKNVPADYLLELAPGEMAWLLYPAPYTEALLEYAPPRGVDPRFVLSIARQETRFQPEAKSVAAARGLMQFIPSTALSIAAELGKRTFEQDDLYYPDAAILFGSQYLGNLFKQFPGQPEAVAASYNGGDDNMARWMARSRSDDPDRYVVEIGFSQTKDYVFKVMANYRVYQTLYSDKLQRQ
jgi:soluble lytic murein transglycosylase